MTMHCFIADGESSAISVVAWDFDSREAIFVYKTNGKPAGVAYKYKDVQPQDMLDALYGDTSIGKFANSLKDPALPAEQRDANFGKTPTIQKAIRDGKVLIAEGIPFHFGNETIGDLIALKRLRDEVAAGNPDPWSFITGTSFKIEPIVRLEHSLCDAPYSW